MRVKVGDVLGRWRLLYSGRNAAGTPIWLCQCKCLVIREIREAALTPRSRCWLCGHQPAPKPRAKWGTRSKFRGVTFDAFARLKKPWRVAIQAFGLHHFCGRYRTEEEAARAHDRAALALIGPTAQLNFPRDQGD
jgi:hypothetical protein